MKIDLNPFDEPKEDRISGVKPSTAKYVALVQRNVWAVGLLNGPDRKDHITEVVGAIDSLASAGLKSFTGS